MTSRMRWKGRVLSCLAALVVVLSTFGVWLQDPQSVNARWNCAQCFGKVHWFGARNSFAGSFTKAITPLRTEGAPTVQYYGSWLWDDVLYSFITIGMLKEVNVQQQYSLENFYFGWQHPGQPYQQVIDQGWGAWYGYDTSLLLRREWSDPNRKFYASYYQDGIGRNNFFILDIQLQPMRASIGLDVRGNNMSISGNSWHDNLYILNDGTFYPHRGMQDDETISYPPIACYWRPAPTDYSSIGGNLECEGL